MITRVVRKIAVTAAQRKQVERRQARRVAPGRLTPCLIRATGEDENPGWVHNLSVRGTGLLSAQPFAPGTTLTVLFINAAHTFAVSAEIQVVRCYRVVNGDHYLGGQFLKPLRYDELLPFMV
jgi:PilZ domain